ncbi:MAG: redoxin domain-containing protein, partial [Halobacteria archaeon]|nr:redoxin domain-containing protein [Halobacteria archaeon]
TRTSLLYTNDFSPDCIDEWCSFRDFNWFASGEEVQVVGVSKSRVGTHRRFIDYLNLNFPLYSDKDLEVAEMYGVKYRTFKLVPRSRRSCFLIDPDLRIRYRWVGEHWLDPTRDTPPIQEIYEEITKKFGGETETFGFG